MASLESYLGDLIEQMQQTWQRLPIHERFVGAEPIPLPVRVASYKGGRHDEQSDQSYSSPEEAAEEVIATQAVTLMTGEPGAGKTTATKWLTRHFAEIHRACHGPQALVPVWVDLGEYFRADSLEQILERERKHIPRGTDQLNYLWILDGFDVLAGFGRIVEKHLVRDAERLASDTGNRFLIAGRQQQSILGAFDHRSSDTRLELLRLTPELSGQWIDKYCPDSRLAYERFRSEHPQAAPFLNVPLFFAMAISATVDQKHPDRKFDVTQYSGRAGLFHGFVDYALKRRELDHDHGYREVVVASVFYEAIKERQEDRFMKSRVEDYLQKAWPGHGYEEKLAAWNSSFEILDNAGLLELKNGKIRALHQQFAEYWAAFHLARRLEQAHEKGWLTAELWDHFQEQRLDPITGQAIAILAAWNKDPDWPRKAISLLGDEIHKDRVSIWLQAGFPLAVEPLIKLLNDPKTEEDLLYKILFALVELGATEAAGPLIDLLKDQKTDDELRDRVVYALGELGATEAAGPLIDLLKDPKTDDELRGRAAFSLVELGSTEAAGPLIDLLKDPKTDDELRGSVVYALVELGATEAAGPLIDLLKDQKTDNELRGSVVSSLGKLDTNARVTDAIISKLTKAKIDYFWVQNVARCLGRRVSPPSMQAVLEQQRDKRNRSQKGKSIVVEFYGGTFNNCILNIDSSLDHVEQSIRIRSGNNEDAMAVLEELKAALKDVAKKGHTSKAEEVAQLAKGLDEQAKDPKANPSMLRLTKKGLIDAATALLEVAPAVLPLAQKLGELLTSM